MVGRLCIAVWGLSKKGQRDPGGAYLKADRLGLAFQRTNILRDFAEDYDRVPRRVYIAHEVFDRFGLNPELLRRIGEITALETRATGMEWTFAPTVAVPQDDRWGRTYEGYSESPEVVASYSAAVVEGLQGKVGSPDSGSESR